MKKFYKLLSTVTIVGVLLIGVADQAFAQATRTWVSGVGDDVNPCSRTAPCKTFAGAISKTAVNGEINCIDSGGFGSVTINKSITIDCKGSLGGVLNAGTNGVIINAGINDKIALRNLNINGAGTGVNGIYVISAANLHVSNVNIFGQNGSGIYFQPTIASSAIIEETTIRHNRSHGVYFKPAAGINAKLHISKSSIVGNSIAGLRADDGAIVSFSDSIVQSNGTNGVLAFASGTTPTIIMMERVVSSGNSAYGVMSNGQKATIAMSNVTTFGNNIGAMSLNGGILLTFGNNGALANSGASSPATLIGSF